MNRKFLKLVELMVEKRVREMTSNKNYIQEFGGRTMATESLREVMDDILVATEMLIDEKYGEVPLEEFKKMWYKATDRSEKQFANILKNMSR
jgi:hypothetical protein